MRFLGLVWATAVMAALAISGVAESSVAEAQDFESADTIVKGQTQPALNELGKAGHFPHHRTYRRQRNGSVAEGKPAPALDKEAPPQ